MSIDIEDLNKSQIILLTLLVSFVTSIATGIVTVSLMEKAPKDVVRVVQRVVERTVEKVESAKPENKDEKQVIEKVIEKTVVVTEADLLAKAVSSVRPKLYRIYDASGNFASFAFSFDGSFVVSAAHNIDPNAAYILKNSTGQEAELEFAQKANMRDLAKFKLKNPEALNLKSLTFPDKDVVLGQTVFVFNDDNLQSIAKGAIVSTQNAGFNTNISASLDTAVAFDINGNVVGIKNSAPGEESAPEFVKFSIIKAFLENENVPQGGEEGGTNNEQASSTQADASAQSTSTQANLESSQSASAADATE